MRSTVALQAAYDGMVAAGFGQGDELAAPKVQPRPQPALAGLVNGPSCTLQSNATTHQLALGVSECHDSVLEQLLGYT